MESLQTGLTGIRPGAVSPYNCGPEMDLGQMSENECSRWDLFDAEMRPPFRRVSVGSDGLSVQNAVLRPYQ